MQSPAARGLTGRIARLRPDRVTLLLAALAVLSAAFILAGGANYGVGVTPDSLAHFQNAESIAAIARGLPFETAPIEQDYPPLFPLFLAFGILLGSEPIDAAAALNAGAFALTLFLCAQWLRRRAQSRFAVAWAAAALFLAPPLLHTATWAYAEPLFILFAMLALFSLDKFLQTRLRSALLFAAIFAALACLTRYVGVSVAAAGFLLLLLQPNAKLLDRARNAVVYSAIAVAPLGLWLLRNFLATGTVTEQGRYAAANSFTNNLLALGDRAQEALFGWSGAGTALIGDSRSAAVLAAEIVGGLIAAALLAGVCLLLWNERARRFASRIRAHPHAPPFAVLAFFCLIYVALLLVGVSVQGVESVSLRYFAPAWPPVLLMAALTLDATLGRRSANASLSETQNAEGAKSAQFRLASLAVMAALLLWLTPQAAQSADLFRQRLNHPLGLDNRSWTNSPAIQAVRAGAAKNPVKIGTNNHFVASFLTGIKAQYDYVKCASPAGVEEWISRARGEGYEEVYVVWIDGGGAVRGCEGGLALIRSVAPLQTVDRFPNGAMFRVADNSANPLDAHRSAYAYAASAEPVIESEFAVHQRGGVLTYVRESCGPADTQAKFFLHVIPLNERDLSYDRRRYGFDNRDFVFDTHGARFDGKCLTTAVLPNYPIARVRTGQFVRGGGRLWEGEFRPSP